MQEKTTLGYVNRFILAITYVLMWGLIFATWGFFALAVIGIGDVIDKHGLFSARVLLDARLGYFGIFSFGTASCALILAGKTNLRSKIILFRVFKITFYISLGFFMHTTLSNWFYAIYQF